MDKLDFALSLIRSPALKRLTDRTFLQSVGTAATALGGVVAIWRTQGVPVDQKVNVTMAALGAVATVVSVWNASEKRKDTEIAKAVLASTIPSIVETPKEALATLALSALAPKSLNGDSTSAGEEEDAVESE